MWSPDGRLIAFSRSHGANGHEIDVMHADGTGRHRLVTGYQALYAAWQPLQPGRSCLGELATVAGTPCADVLVGTAGRDVITGSGGNDTIWGLGGDDLLCGGDGKDALVPSAGNDVVNGGAGADRVSYRFAPAGVTVNLTTGAASGEGIDTFIKIENAIGSAFADTLAGSTLLGLGGNDTLRGAAGNDLLRGGEGDDTIDGGDGIDRCVQGPGAGSLTNCP